MVNDLSSAAEQRVAELKKRYPDSRSAIMPAMYIAQEELGYVSDEAIEWVADRVGVAPAHVREVATFYTMYYKKPVGRYHIQICRTLSCALCGMRELTKYLHGRFGVAPGEVTSDGMWSYEEVECLGSCGSGPMVEINDIYFEHLDTDRLKEILDRIEEEQPNLRYSTVRDALGEGLSGHPRSQVMREEEQPS